MHPQIYLEDRTKCFLSTMIWNPFPQHFGAMFKARLSHNWKTVFHKVNPIILLSLLTCLKFQECNPQSIFNQPWYGEFISISIFGQCSKHDCHTIDKQCFTKWTPLYNYHCQLVEVSEMLPGIHLEIWNVFLQFWCGKSLLHQHL